MVVVEHLVSPAALPRPPAFSPAIEQLSILSYNVLLPNSMDGWWTYKMYNPPLPEDAQYQSSWEYRRDLLKERFQLVDADVVCLQEVAPNSFEEDFAFMQDLGYDGVEMFKKGRFRPATFWKTSICELAVPAVHKDRCLITAFRMKKQQQEQDDDDDDDNTAEAADAAKKQTKNVTTTAISNKHWFVCNCHLQAGKQAPRRVRQINEAMRGILTLARKLKEPEPEKLSRVIVCGDFNGGEECGAVRYLEDGYIDEHFREDDEPVSSNRKELPFAQPLMDVSSTVESRTSPPTMVVSEVMSTLMDVATYNNPVLCQSMKERLERIYTSKLATHHDGQMNFDDVKRWLMMINKDFPRGDEYREAARQMGWVDPNPEDAFEVKKKRVQMPDDGILTLDGFIHVYQKELEGGKFWGICHDMAVLGEPLPDVGLYSGRYDRMYCSTAIQPVAVLDTISDKSCPNDVEPSDHLPVGASLRAKT